MPDWYQEYFGEEYLLLYPHRDEEDARRLVAALARTVSLTAGWRVLDVACGTGRHAAAFRDLGRRGPRLDPPRQLLQGAREDGGIPVIRPGVREIPVGARSMDL